MASYFLDTSAIVKRYFPEQGHSWILALCLPAHQKVVINSWAWPVSAAR